MASAPQICGLLPPPNRNDVVTAVQLTIGCIRRRWGHTAKDIAGRLKQPNGDSPDPETISRAERGETLPSFDLLAQIACIYGDCADPLRRVMEAAPTTETPSLEDRVALIEREAAAIRKELKS